MEFSKLLSFYKERQEERESERQGKTITLAWNQIATQCKMERRKLYAWCDGQYKPESKKIEGKEKARSEVHRLAQFFELTEEERSEFLKAAGFKVPSQDEDPTTEPKILYYFGIKGLLTKEQKKKLFKLVRQIRNIFSEPSLIIQFEIEGEITDEQLEKMVEDIRDTSDDPQITLLRKEEAE